MTQAEHADTAFRAPDPPTPEAEMASRKRAAVELIRAHDTALRSSARRYSICADDADDAYQRGIEILLSKAPTTDLRQLLPWTRTVIKHEALAVRKQRERILGRPGSAARDDEAEDWINLIPATGDGPDERAVKREKVARSREALAQLKPQELKALTMLAEGYSYAEIAAINSWTRTKVNRCLAEGRQSFRSKFRESEAGELCAGFGPLISAGCDGEISAADLERLENHLAACGHCRATLRAFRAAPRAAAALFPALPLGQSIYERAQEAFVSLQTRFNGLGGGSEATVTSVAVSGGTRGAGMAAFAKLATVCVGAAGGAACVATGVIPAPALLPDNAQEREATPAASERPAPAAGQPPDPIRQDPQLQPDPAPASGTGPERQQTPVRQNRSANAPQATPTETEFTPEAAGTAVQSVEPPPVSSAPAPAATPPPSAPVGGGGGEFGP